MENELLLAVGPLRNCVNVTRSRIDAICDGKLAVEAQLI